MSEEESRSAFSHFLEEKTKIRQRRCPAPKKKVQDRAYDKRSGPPLHGEGGGGVAASRHQKCSGIRRRQVANALTRSGDEKGAGEEGGERRSAADQECCARLQQASRKKRKHVKNLKKRGFGEGGEKVQKQTREFLQHHGGGPVEESRSTGKM